MIPVPQPQLQPQSSHSQDQSLQQALQQQRKAELIGNGGGNRFFDPGGGSEEPGPGRVYAAVEVPEPEDGSNDAPPQEPVYLECVDTQWFHDQSSLRGEDLARALKQSPLVVLELTGYPRPPFPAGLEPGDIAWFEFGYSPASPSKSDAVLHTNLYSAGSGVKIDFHEPRDSKWPPDGPFSRGAWLTPLLGTNQWGSSSFTVGAALARAHADAGVAVYDVGQGSCQAALNGDGIPSLYVDFGGGVLGNTNTFPKAGYRGFCFSTSPAIMLSHWDWDHWSSAYRFPGALEMLWIAPPVPEKPIQQAFAADLYMRGNLAVWDSSFPADLRARAVRVERCTGRTVNDSGLAVTIYPGVGKRKTCLLPGDASYQYIPSVNSGGSFNSLCLTHHGGRLHSVVIPKAKRGGRAVCSVGAGNSYKHPFLETFDAHVASGWPLPLTTGLSGPRPTHLVLDWDGQPRLFRGGCHGTYCNVARISK